MVKNWLRCWPLILYFPPRRFCLRVEIMSCILIYILETKWEDLWINCSFLVENFVNYSGERYVYHITCQPFFYFYTKLRVLQVILKQQNFFHNLVGTRMLFTKKGGSTKKSKLLIRALLLFIKVSQEIKTTNKVVMSTFCRKNFICYMLHQSINLF